MAKNYYYAEVETSDLLLDEENPRFASSALVRESAISISHDEIISHV